MHKQHSSSARKKHLWLVRLGRKGEYEPLALSQGILSINFGISSDLTRCLLREHIAQIVSEALPDSTPSRCSNITGQLHRFSNEIVVGDIIVCPLRTLPIFAIGEATGPYLQLTDGRPARPVRWHSLKATRAQFGQDLLYSLGALLTVCQIRRPNGVARVMTIAETGADPG